MGSNNNTFWRSMIRLWVFSSLLAVSETVLWLMQVDREGLPYGVSFALVIVPTLLVLVLIRFLTQEP